MEQTRLSRLRNELAKARKKRDDWDSRVKDLERRYREAENTCIHDMVHAANLTPEQLAELIRSMPLRSPAAVGMPIGDASTDYEERETETGLDLVSGEEEETEA